MPWLETAPVNERTRFIADDRLGLYTTTELCARYNISRKTGYKWLARYHEDGRRGLTDRSHAPHHCPHRMAPEIAELLCAARRHHPDWGSGKLLDWLAPRHPEIAEAAWPAVSTAGDLLAREGLVKRRRRRRPHQHPGVVPPTTAAPNDLWTADFKGQFPTRDGVWCYPLTIADQHTRYLLACRGLPNIKGHGARPVFEHAFREFGLPRAIRTDNGVPFASPNALFNLSRLSVWWLRLGIAIERIKPGNPQQNGRHERMHLTLKLETTKPAGQSFLQQQAKFDDFIDCYNNERPHQALNMQYPAQRYRSSPRTYRGLPALDYPFHDKAVTVTTCGRICFNRQKINLSQVFAGQTVGIKQTDDRIWLVSFMDYDLGYFDDETCRLEPLATNPFGPKVLPMSSV